MADNYIPYVKVEINDKSEVCISGNHAGLLWFARMCIVLARHPEEGHIHLQNEGDYLDKKYLNCTLYYCARDVFMKNKQSKYTLLLVMLIVAITLISSLAFALFG